MNNYELQFLVNNVTWHEMNMLLGYLPLCPFAVNL